MIIVSPDCRLADDDVEIKFIHASGPGGQNVNKVATAAQLRFAIGPCGALSEEVKMRLRELARNKISAGDELVITARRYRTQARNRQDAIDRLCEIIRKALVKPKKRLKSKPPARVARQRLEGKRRKSEKKQLRRPVEM